MTYNNYHYMVIELLDKASSYNLTDKQMDYLADFLWSLEEVMCESN